MTTPRIPDNPRTAGTVTPDVSDMRLFLRGIIGSAILLLATKAVELLFFGPGYYSSLAQHPFWIIVLIAALADGLFVGVATAGLAAMMMDWPPRPIGVDITSHYIDIAILPLQWLMVALCVGALRQIEIRNERAMKRRNDELVDMNEALAEEVQRLDAAVESMEVAAITREGSEQVGIAERLVALRHADRDDLSRRFAEAAALYTAQPSVLLTWDGETSLTPVAEIGREGLSVPIPASEALFRQLKDSLAGILLEGAPIEGTDGVLVAAPIHSRGGQFVGAVLILARDKDQAGEQMAIAELLASVLSTPLSAVAEPVRISRLPNFLVVGGKGD